MNDSEKKTAETKEKKSAKTKKKRGKRISAGKIFLIVLVVLVIAGAVVMLTPALRSRAMKLLPGLGNNAGSGDSAGYQYYTVTRTDITTTLTGTGTLEPYDSYTITATVTGDILSAPFEEMDEVLEDQPLYVIDSSDIEDDIEDKQKDVDDALEEYNDIMEEYADLNIYSDYAGTVREVYVEEGDRVSDGTPIAYVVDNGTMLLEIPFFAANTDYIRNGASATVTFAATGEVLSGTVREISNLTSVNDNNSTIRNITIAVTNPGGITFGMQAYASAVGSDGNTYDCAGAGSFKYNEEETVTATYSGEIETLYLEEGSVIRKGALAAVISAETLDDQAEQLKKAYDNQVKALDDLNERLEDYTIKAPISGTIVQKNYKELDTIGSSSMSSTTSLAIIYDMSKLTFDLAIDELDLEKIQVGQKVNVTSDSIAGAEFEGIITKKSIVGSSSGGTTVYPVTVELEGNDRLLPGMNVNAEIILTSYENVLAVPVSAVSRGGKIEIAKGGIDSERPSGVITEKPETEIVDVVLGASNDDYIEITEGVSEGDIVIYEIQNMSQNAFAAMFGGMGMSGVMPAGGMGMGGGMPSGGGNMGGNRGGNMGGGMPGGR